MPNKMKIEIKSDGSAAGTTLKVNGTDITDAENVTAVEFFARGGLVYSDGDSYGPRLGLAYSTLEQDGEGTMIRKRFTYDPDTTSLTMEEKPIGKGDMVSDALVGKESDTIKKIRSYVGKVKFVPDVVDLETRTQDSLNDLLSDLEREVGEK